MNTTLTTLLRTSLVTIALAYISGCGQKGPLVLEQVPVDQTQAPLANSIDEVPVETPSQTATQEETDDIEKSE